MWNIYTIRGVRRNSAICRVSVIYGAYVLDLTCVTLFIATDSHYGSIHLKLAHIVRKFENDRCFFMFCAAPSQ